MRTKNKIPYKRGIGEPECNKGDEGAKRETIKPSRYTKRMLARGPSTIPRPVRTAAIFVAEAVMVGSTFFRPETARE
jgi:hypothetical protein